MQTLAILSAFLFAALPATTNYKLNSYGFGSGGTANSSTATYAIEGSGGELNGQAVATGTYGGKPGYTQTQQANVPTLALDNESNLDYNKLHFVIDTQANPTDAKYLIAITTDSAFSTGIQYLQPDGTLHSTLATGDYQTYSAWGGAGGSYIIGLNPSTTYYAKVRATQGKFTESAFGPTPPASGATAGATLTFALSTSATSTPPFTVSLGTLSAGTVNTSVQSVNTTLSTNGASGGDVYIRSQNGGLLSGTTGNTITSTSTDLASASRGFGGQNSSVSQASGGPYSVVSPYNGTANTVGIINSTTRSLYTSTLPVTNGAGVLNLKAKSATTDVAATDYQEILTLVAAANF